MRRVSLQRTRTLLLASLFLVVLANLGLTVHSGHHALGSPHTGTRTLSLAGHPEPDPTLHLESVTEVRTLACPGCLLQQQIEGSHLQNLGGFDLPSHLGNPTESTRKRPLSSLVITSFSRGPPSC